MTRVSWLLAGLAVLGLLGTGDPAEAGRRRVPPLVLFIDGPDNGTFDDTGSVTVTGSISGAIAVGVTLDINGAAVTVQPDLTFSHVVTLDEAAIFNPITTVLTKIANGVQKRDRRVVIAGDSVHDGDFSLQGIALRLNDTGLDQLEGVIASLVDLDPATLVPPGTLVIDNFCYWDSIFGCLGRVDVSIDTDPSFPPSISGFGLDIDSQTDMAFGDITLDDLFVRARVDDATGVPLTCFINITTSTTSILGDYTLEPDSLDPSFIDVAQLGGVNVQFANFNDTTDCNGLLGGLVELLIGLFIGDVETLFDDAFSDFLNQADGNGNTPVAGAIETALGDISITGPLSESLGVNLEAPLFQVVEDNDGITLGSDGRIQAVFGTDPGECSPPAGTPDLSASYHVDQPFPTLGATTPGALPYGLGICISTSTFNQLLKASIECGLLQVDLAEIDLLGIPQPLTAGLLAVFIPQFGDLDPALPLVARIRPTTSPVLTGNVGPAGELSEMRAGQLLVDLASDSGTPSEIVYLTVGVDFRAGLDFSFDAVTASLVPSISDIATGDVQVGVIDSVFNDLDIATVELILQQLLSLALPTLGDTLGTFPFPTFFGLNLSTVEVSRQGEFISIFADLTP